jgi:hypothetical protein
MGQNIASADDALPRDLRLCLLKCIGSMPRGLSYDLDISFHRAPKYTVLMIITVQA